MTLYNYLRDKRLQLEFMKNKIKSQFGKIKIIQNKQGKKLYVRSWTDDEEIVKEVDEIYNNAKLNKKSVVIDIGGHIGSFSIKIADKVNKVYAFEPEWNNYSLFRDNIKLNNIRNIDLSFLGVSNKTTQELIKSPYSTGAYGVGEGNIGKVTINCIRLQDELDKIGKVDLIKIDCEGSEYDILYNLPDEYFKLIKQIEMEVHERKGVNNSDSLKSFLSSREFKIKVYDNNSGHKCFYCWRKDV